MEVPSGKHTKSYWTWPFIVDLPIKNGGFSIAMLVYQRVVLPAKNVLRFHATFHQGFFLGQMCRVALDPKWDKLFTLLVVAEKRISTTNVLKWPKKLDTWIEFRIFWWYMPQSRNFDWWNLSSFWMGRHDFSFLAIDGFAGGYHKEMIGHAHFREYGWFEQ